MIVAVAAANDCMIVTDNEKHFAGREVLKAWQERRVCNLTGGRTCVRQAV
jgi:hypothetical protein